jgi:oligopeptide transport system ATP-binding protein
MAEPLLRVEDLHREFHVRGRRKEKLVVRAVDGVTLELARGETLAVVGESGSGKTTLARMVIGLVTPTSGRMTFDGAPLDWRGRDARPLRRRIQMIFQDPMGSLDPRWRVRDLIREPLDNFADLDKAAREAAVDEVLEHVGLDRFQGSKRAGELSGGQRQRVGIARAIVLRPELVICDEPVSALDVSMRGQILNLLARLREELGLTYVFISHDMSTVEKLADRVATMYLGRVAELGPVASYFSGPLHPYAQALLSAAPVADPEIEATRAQIVLAGEPADATRIPSGCRFHPRCPLAQDRCVEEEPALREARPGRWASCHFAPEARIEPGTVDIGMETEGAR